MIHYMSTNGVGDAWVGNELHVLRQKGIPFVLHALRPATRKLFASPWAAEMNRDTRVVYPLPKLSFALSVLIAPFLFHVRFLAALCNAIFGRRESLRVRASCFWHLWVACHWARSLRGQDVSHVHSQWIHSGGSVAMYGAWLLGVSFSFTGHAADIYRERVALVDKVKRAEFIVCISEHHREFFRKLGAREEQLVVAYCGIDTSMFTPRTHERTGVLEIRSSGRLVEKKGFTHLIEACRILAERRVTFRCTIAGSGPLLDPLKKQVIDSNLEGLVTLTGVEIKQEEIPAFMYGGDVYALPCVWAKDNDVDGLPQMLMEAMACGLPAVSTRLVGIPDLVLHGETGLLVEPNDASQLAEAILTIGNDPALATRLATRAREHLLAKFDLSTSLDPLIAQYRRKLWPLVADNCLSDRDSKLVGQAA